MQLYDALGQRAFLEDLIKFQHGSWGQLCHSLQLVLQLLQPNILLRQQAWPSLQKLLQIKHLLLDIRNLPVLASIGMGSFGHGPKKRTTKQV